MVKINNQSKTGKTKPQKRRYIQTKRQTRNNSCTAAKEERLDTFKNRERTIIKKKR